jgi:hypothetical protein
MRGSCRVRGGPGTRSAVTSGRPGAPPVAVRAADVHLY